MSTQDDEAPQYGTFMDPSSDDECVEYESEGYEKYEPGKYYPICLGEILIKRFRVEHKISHGGYSTVWMAYDMLARTNVALKISVSGPEAENEYRIHQEIVKTVSDTSNMALCLYSFLLQAGQFSHRVLVLPLLGCDLRSHHVMKLPMRTRMLGAKTLLVTLSNLHSAGIVHRDLSNGNVMWGMRKFDDFDINDKYKTFGEPKKLHTHTPWKSGELVKPMDLPRDFLTDEFYLADFGISIKIGTSVNPKWVGSPAYRAPELFHGKDPSFASDMWSYMCLFTELYCVAAPFRTWGRETLLERQKSRLGPLPQEWRALYEGPIPQEEGWYDQTTTLDPERSLRKMLEFANRRNSGESDAKIDLILSFMQRVFSYLLESRLTAVQLLNDPDFNAFIGIYGL